MENLGGADPGFDGRRDSARGADTLSGPNALDRAVIVGGGGGRPGPRTYRESLARRVAVWYAATEGPSPENLRQRRAEPAGRSPTAAVASLSLQGSSPQLYPVRPGNLLSGSILMWFKAAGARVSPAPSFNAPAAPPFISRNRAGGRPPWSAVPAAGHPGKLIGTDHIYTRLTRTRNSGLRRTHLVCQA